MGVAMWRESMGRESGIILVSLLILFAGVTAFEPTGNPHEFITNDSEAIGLVVGDAMVSSNNPNLNYGTEIWIGVCDGQEFLVKFDLNSIPNGVDITSARLNLKYMSGDNWLGFEFYETGSSWAENTITWSNAPATTGSAVSANIAGYLTDLSIDLTTFFDGHSGVSSIRTTPTYCSTGYSRGWYSRQTANPPKLVVKYLIPNTAPVITGWSASDQVFAGEVVNFSADWFDGEGDNGTLYVCRTIAECSAAPENQWCGGSVTNTTAECSYTTSPADNGSHNYYAFVCDDYDGSCSGAIPDSFEVLYGPKVENVAIAPGTAYKIHTLTGSGDYSDADNKEQNASFLAWWINGVPVKNETMAFGNEYGSSTLTPAEGNFTVGDIVEFGFRACNEIEQCAPMKNASVVIQNAPPVIEIVEKTKYYINGDVVLQANIYNLDDDPLTVVWEWKLNNVLTADNSSIFSLNNSYVRGDNISYQVNATDGIDTTSVAGVIMIANYAPSFSSHGITSPAYTGTSLSCSWELLDIEETDLNATVGWYKNNVQIPEWDSEVSCVNATQCTASVGVAGNNVSYGDGFICEVAASDGIDFTIHNSSITVTSNCGDNVKEGSEQCDGTDTPSGKTCTSQCMIHVEAPPGGGGSGGGGGDSGANIAPTPTAEPLSELIEEELPLTLPPLLAAPVPTAMPTVTAEPTPVATPTPTAQSEKKETADLTGLISYATGPIGWGILLLMFAVLIYLKRETVVESIKDVEIPEIRLPRKQAPIVRLKPVQRLPQHSSKFPMSDQKRAAIVGEIARMLEEQEGKFHAAGIWRELYNQYGDSVVRDRIYIEKWIGDWLRDNAQYTGSYRNAKYYKF